MMNFAVEQCPCALSLNDISGWLKTAQGWAIFVAIFGGLGNLVTIAAVLPQLVQSRHWERGNSRLNMSISSSNRNIRRPVTPLLRLEGDTILLVHLIFCDLLYCSINLPITAVVYEYSLNKVEHIPDLLCSKATIFRYANAIAEWLTLGLLMLERCIDLERLKTDRLFRPKTAVISIVFIWCFSVAIPFIVTGIEFLVTGEKQVLAGYNNCTHKCDFKNIAVKEVFYTIETMIPSIFMTFGCFNIIYQIWRNKMKLKNLGMPDELVRQRTLELWRSTSVLLGLLILYLLCVVPICITNMITVLNIDCTHEHQLMITQAGIGVYMVYWIQYGINFLVYACGNPKIRKAHRQLPVLIRDTLIKFIFSKDFQDHELKSGCYRIGPAIISVTRFENDLKNELTRGISKDKLGQKNILPAKKHVSWPIVHSIPKDTKEVKEKFGTFSSGMSWVSSNNTLESILTSKSLKDISRKSIFKMDYEIKDNSLNIPRCKLHETNDTEEH